MNGRRVRVVTLIDSLSTAGGAEKLAAEVTLRLDPERFQRVFCASRGYADEAYVRAFAAEGIELVRLDRGSRLDVRAWLPLLRELRTADILHTHKFESNVWGATWGRRARVPVIVAHEHTWSYEGKPHRRFLDRELVARTASAFVMVSREDQRRAEAVEGVDPRRMLYLPNGVAPLVPSGYDVRAELGISADALVCGTVSVLRPQKALHVLLEATARLRRDRPELHVVIAGDGGLRRELEGLAARLHPPGKVHFLGRRSDVADVVAALDVAVCCSDFEGSPLSVMEYMSAGAAIVATRVGGVPDLIEDRVHGLLVPRRDPDALAAAVGELLASPALRATLGGQAAARYEREFRIDALVGRIERLYESLHAVRRLPRNEQLRAVGPTIEAPVSETPAPATA